MNKVITFLLAICLLASGCKKEKKKMPYMLTLSVMKYDIKGHPFYLEKQREGILAENDTLAYYKALRIVALNRIPEAKYTARPTQRTVMFKLKYGLRDTGESLSPETIDRLHLNLIKKYPEIS